MNSEEVKAIFDQQAVSYDERWAKTAPIRDALHLLTGSILNNLPGDARILCVGVGTGEELNFLAKQFPEWTFTAIDPSGPMLEAARQKAERGGFSSRCYFHEGYLDSLPVHQILFDAATCFLVSQFILELQARERFFRSIATRLRVGGTLVSSDLASDVNSHQYETLLKAWLNMMSNAGIPASGLEQMRAAYAKDVAILPPPRVAALIQSAGFEEPVQFYQAGLIHAWASKRAQSNAG